MMTPSTKPTERSDVVALICGELSRCERVLITSHLRPDGDSIGSQLALAFALRSLGKQVRVVNADPAAATLLDFPGVRGIEIADRVDGAFDAVVVLECANLARTGVAGLDGRRIINIDHHPGNGAFGAINWFDGSASACGEMVFDIITGLGVGLTPEIAVHVYIAILTDTGSFHFSAISPRTFDICRQLLEAGVDPVFVARTVYDDNTVGRLRLFAAVIGTLQLDDTGRLALLCLDREMARRAGATYDDTEGLINQPLTVKEIQAVVFFKEWDASQSRVSLRSKGSVDVGAVAKRFGGGGHKNAAGCTVVGGVVDARRQIVPLVLEAIDQAARAPSGASQPALAAPDAAGGRD